MSMTHHERIDAAIAHEQPDRTPIALWRHFPNDDQTAEGLATAIVDFQKRFDFDLVKVTEASGYPAEAWGAELEDAGNAEGTRRYVKRVVEVPEHWQTLPSLSVGENEVFARELHALSLIREGVGPDVPVLPTIFSPLTVAKQMAGDRMLDHLRDHPGDLEAGLRTIAETNARFAAECLNHGADAIFFATQFASHDLLSDEEYRRFGVEYDLPVLEAVRDRARFVLLHLHGTNPMFGLASAYPVGIVNWHDRETEPSLAQGHRMFRNGAVCGGLDRNGLVDASPEDAKTVAREAIDQTDGRGLILSTGCVTLTTTPEANIQATRQAVESQA